MAIPHEHQSTVKEILHFKKDMSMVEVECFISQACKSHKVCDYCGNDYFYVASRIKFAGVKHKDFYLCLRCYGVRTDGVCLF